jgi:arginyl-tRNA synthetase
MRAIELLKDSIRGALTKGINRLGLSSLDLVPPLEFEIPRNENHGDYSTNIALILAPSLGRSARDIASIILDHFEAPPEVINKAAIAGPGFINFTFSDHFWYDQLREIYRLGNEFGKLNIGAGKKIQIEFVSANPTGPLHVGHGRIAALGDALAKVLAFSSYEVTTEYYLNDIGNQMATLGRSVLFRYRELLGQATEFPTGHYQGEYIYDIARAAIVRFGEQYLECSEADALPAFTQLAQGSILEGIKQDLDDFSVTFNNWFSEKSLFDQGLVENTISTLRENNHIYQKDGASWFAASRFGDEKDRVVVRSNGQQTYFASDMAYHQNKFSRGFDQVIDIWGADHHGYVPRMRALVQALGYDQSRLRILLVQLVSLLRAGVPVAMSTRMGQFVSLREVLDEVGRDAARYIFLTRRSDAPLEFDLDLAKKQSDENPVYYVQYAHARLCSILRVAAEKDIDITSLARADYTLLTAPGEISLIKKMAHLPDVIEKSALSLEPHRITIFLQDVVSTFHRYYHSGKLDSEKRVVIAEQLQVSRARLSLVHALRIIIGNCLSLLGVSAPEKM